MATQSAADKDAPAKRRRFEGFIHQKINPNLQKALSFLASEWHIPEQDVPERAIQETAMNVALAEDVKQLSSTSTPRRANAKSADKKQSGDRVKELTAENERLNEALAELKHKFSELEKRQEKLKGVLDNASELLRLS